jgi:CheY-like chemotaxis protein
VKTVLVVDDEPAIRDVVADILLDHGFDVVLAWSGRRMLEFLESSRPSLIVLDVMMPDGDGLGAFRTMRARPGLREIPVVMMSATLGPGQLSQEIAGFLPKPFDLDRLLEVVVGVIGDPAT